MEKISTEAIVSSLFVLGFDKVDSLLYTYLLGKLTIDNHRLSLFEFEEKPFSELFIKYVDYDNSVFKIKDGYTLDTNVSPIEDYNWTLRDLFSRNCELIEYLNNLDFSEIVAKKLESYNIARQDDIEQKFSTKEITLIEQLNTTRLKEKAWNPGLWEPLGIKPVESKEYVKSSNSTGGFLPFQNPDERYEVRGIMPSSKNKTLELTKKGK